MSISNTIFVFLFLLIASFGTVFGEECEIIFESDTARSLDKVPPVFTFAARPYSGNRENYAFGIIRDFSGNRVGFCIAAPMDKINPSYSEPPVEGDCRFFLARADRKLPQGIYRIEVIHRLDGVQTRDSIPLVVSASYLSKEDSLRIASQTSLFAYYGMKPQIVNISPPYGGIFSEDEFYVRFRSDDSSKVVESNGLSLSAAESFVLTSDMDSVFVSAFWKQPFSEMEAYIFDERGYEINQPTPLIRYSPSSVSVLCPDEDRKNLRIFADDIGIDYYGVLDTRDFETNIEIVDVVSYVKFNYYGDDILFKPDSYDLSIGKDRFDLVLVLKPTSRFYYWMYYSNNEIKGHVEVKLKYYSRNKINGKETYPIIKTVEIEVRCGLD